jgi:addiction module RelE/StbE family toxin
MIKLEWSSSFERALKKWLTKHPADRALIESALERFTANPQNPELRNHKLSGQLKGLRAISVAYDCRIVFAMVEDDTALLVSIGTHEEVY